MPKRTARISRREFLKRSGQAAILTSVGSHCFRSEAARLESIQTDGCWPMYRGNRCLTGRAVLPGEMRTAPKISWKHEVEAGLVWMSLDPTPGSSSQPVKVQRSDLVADYFHSEEGKKWKLGPALVDLYGTGEMVADPGRAAKLLPAIPGLQTIEFQSPAHASNLDPKQAVCFAYDGGKKREVWRSELYDTIQNANFAIADIDHDGKPEVILAPHFRVIVYDGQTGQTRHLLKIHGLRNYGFFCCTDLSGKGPLDIVIIADFAMHMDVVKNEGDHLRLLWRRDIEKEIQSKNTIVRPGPNPVFDVNGDGRKEIVFNLFNHSGDGKWHLMAHDALTGETVLDLAEHYLSGVADVNGDGVLELFTTRTATLHVPTAARLSLLRAGARGVSTLWEHPRAQWVTAPTLLPLTHSTIVAHGTDDIVTANLSGNRKSNFFVLETSSRKAEWFSAMGVNRNGSVTTIYKCELPSRSRALLRSVADVDGDGKDEVLLSFRQAFAQSTRAGRTRNAHSHVVQIEKTGVRQQPTGAGENWPLVAASPSSGARTLILFEGADNDVVAIAPPARPGVHPTQQWRIPGAGAPIMADVNGDGVSEVVFADWSPEGEGQMVAVEARSGRVLWRHVLAGFPGPHPEWNFGGITSWWVGHYTSRARFDVWVSARRSTMHSDEAWLLRGDQGAPVWHLHEVRTNRTPAGVRGWGAGGSFVCSADVDGDGLEDIIHLYPVNYMAAKGLDGRLLQSIESAERLFPGVWGAYCAPMVADFNQDGKNELLWCGSYHHGLTTLDAKLIWFHKGGASMAGLGDVDGDGKFEVGFTGWEQGKGLRCLDAATGELKWEMPLPNNARVPLYTADIDGDGKDEFLFSVGAELYAVNSAEGSGHIVWQVQLPSAPGNLALADIDADGKTEILFIGADSIVYCLDV
jgi:hypothetical protein